MATFRSKSMDTFSALCSVRVGLLFGCKYGLAASGRLLGSYVRSIFMGLCAGGTRLNVVSGFGSCLLVSLGGGLYSRLHEQVFVSRATIRRLGPITTNSSMRRRCLRGRGDYFRGVGMGRLLTRLSPHRHRTLALCCVRRGGCRSVYAVVSVGCRSMQGLVRENVAELERLMKWCFGFSNRCGFRPLSIVVGGSYGISAGGVCDGMRSFLGSSSFVGCILSSTPRSTFR